MKMLIVVLLLSFGAQNVAGIYGGCMSYSTTIESSGHLKVKLFFLNGWKIDKGPCRTCTAADKGSDVTQRRKLLIQQTNNQEMFGKWEAEVYSQNGNASYIDKTRIVNNVSTDVVLIVGEKEGWELIGSEISLDFDLTVKEFDITLNSSLDVSMTLLPVIRHINLQVKVEPGIRNDTNRPNRSPIVLVKPLYSLEIGMIHTIHLTSVDNDGDAIRCENSEYVESSGMGNFVKSLTNQSLISLNRTTCVMNIDVNQSYFHENDTFGVAVTVKDYGTHPLTIQTTTLVPHIPYKNVIGRVVALMYFKITGKTDPPTIIPPTPGNNQEYTIYVGGDFHVDVYAKATVGRKIVRFDFLRRDGKPVNHTEIQNASNISDNAVFISMSWSPTKVDKGHHILCANAEDNERTMTVDLHCFRIVVKENIFRPTAKETEKPYFVSFPEPTDLKCKKDTYCRFPVYATTTHAGGITSIISTPESKENVTIQYSRELVDGTIDAKVAQVEFFASQEGARQICLKASDSHAFSDRCLYVTVELPDPCASEPCQNLGSCQSFDNNTRYNCFCRNGFSGNLCEKRNKPCDPNPCLFNGSCHEVPLPPYFFCICVDERKGDLCDIDRCQAHPCNATQVCQTSGSDVCIPKQEHGQDTTTVASGTHDQGTPVSNVYYRNNTTVSGSENQGATARTTSGHNATQAASRPVVNTPTTSGYGSITPNASGSGAITSTLSGHVAITSVASGSDDVTATRSGVSTPIGSGLGANIQISSGQGQSAPTSTDHGATTSILSGNSATIPTSTGHGATTPTLSGNGATTLTTSGYGATTPTSSGHGATTLTSSGHGAPTLTSSGHVATTPTSSSHGATTPTSSGHGATTSILSGNGATTPTLYGNGATTPTLSGHAATTLTLSGNGATTPTSSGHGATTPPSSGHGATTSTLSGNGATTSILSGNGATTPTSSGHGVTTSTSSGHGATTSTLSGNGATTSTLSGNGATTPTSSGHDATGTITESHCDVLKAKERAKKGRVECFCPYPTSGARTKVITLNPRVSLERLLLAAALGSGAMIIILGLVALLYVITQKCFTSNKTHTELNPEEKPPKKKISTVCMTDKKK